MNVVLFKRDLKARAQKATLCFDHLFKASSSARLRSLFVGMYVFSVTSKKPLWSADFIAFFAAAAVVGAYNKTPLWNLKMALP